MARCMVVRGEEAEVMVELDEGEMAREPVDRILEGLEDCRRVDANQDLRIEAVEG